MHFELSTYSRYNYPKQLASLYPIAPLKQINRLLAVNYFIQYDFSILPVYYLLLGLKSNIHEHYKIFSLINK